MKPLTKGKLSAYASPVEQLLNPLYVAVSVCVCDRMGEAVKPLTKGKLSAYAGPVEQLFSPAHVTMSFSQKHEIRETIIRDKVCLMYKLNLTTHFFTKENSRLCCGN